MNGIAGGLSVPNPNSISQAVQGTPAGAAPAQGQSTAQQAETKRAFQDVWNDIQARMGGKEEKPREIKKTLDKDAFLKIMVTQMKHQDPTKPMDAEKMATELAQISSVEQLQSVNKNLEKLASQNQPSERVALSGFIGKTVTVDRNRFEHIGENKDIVGFNLNEDAASVKIALLSDTGETVLEKDLGPKKAGVNEFIWDGKKTNTLAAKPGLYTFKIEARAANGAPVSAETRSKARVIGVSFEGKEPVLLVGDGQRQDKVILKNVIQIESDSLGAPAQSGAIAAGGIQNQPNSPLAGKGQFFSFTKGEGSKPLDLNKLDPEAKAALMKFASQSGQSAPQVAQASAQNLAQGGVGADRAGEEKGFPNGLSAEKSTESSPQVAKGGDEE